MPGRAALTDKAGVLSDIKTTQMGETPSGAADLTGEYSPIGGEGRKGCDAYGSLTDPMWTRIDAEIVNKHMNGVATGGNTGFNSGDGRTFGGAGGRKED